MTVPARSPEDDALDRARDMVEVLRRGAPGWLLFAERMPDIFDAALDSANERAVAAEAEVQRLREGLREIERGGVGGVRAFARALLADSPDGGGAK